jgi:N-acetylneuraminate lyase
MVAPSYFKPTSVGNLVACCASVASAAPDTPFYYYDIPALTGVRFPMPQFMEQAATAIPTFAGLKFTNFDLGEFQSCQAATGDYDLLWGVDEFYLAALALGARGAIGSTYNFAPTLAHRVEQSFAAGDWKAARQAQLRIVQLVGILAGYGYLPAAKSVMAMLGVEVGPARLPYETLTVQQAATLRSDLEALGFFHWVAP